MTDNLISKIVILRSFLFKRLLNFRPFIQEAGKFYAPWYKSIVLERLLEKHLQFDEFIYVFIPMHEPLNYFKSVLEQLLEAEDGKHLYTIRRITSKLHPEMLNGESEPDVINRLKNEVLEWRTGTRFDPQIIKEILNNIDNNIKKQCSKKNKNHDLEPIS